MLLVTKIHRMKNLNNFILKHLDSAKCCLHSKEATDGTKGGNGGNYAGRFEERS